MPVWIRLPRGVPVPAVLRPLAGGPWCGPPRGGPPFRRHRHRSALDEALRAIRSDPGDELHLDQRLGEGQANRRNSLSCCNASSGVWSPRAWVGKLKPPEESPVQAARVPDRRVCSAGRPRGEAAGPFSTAGFKDRIWCARRMADSANHVSRYVPEGHRFGHLAMPPGWSTPDSPTITVHDGKLWLATRGNDRDPWFLNTTGDTWEHPATIPAGAMGGEPALASHNGKLYAMYRRWHPPAAPSSPKPARPPCSSSPTSCPQQPSPAPSASTSPSPSNGSEPAPETGPPTPPRSAAAPQRRRTADDQPQLSRGR